MEHLSLSALNTIIKTVLDQELDSTYWVIAEIGEMKINQKGHCYLELIEKEGQHIRAKLRATIWSYTFRNLSIWFQDITGQPLKAGMKILCNLSVQYHELYGLSANVKDIDANFTLGEKARKKQQVLRQLAEEGLLERNKALLLPLAPQRVAIISSPTAAGLEDFMHQLKQNSFSYNFQGRLFKALMQGEAAQNSILQALERTRERVDEFDVLVILRGGGSQSDLDCFDGHELAAAVARFPLPVITGIGHEKDESVVDMVAHTKMKTPTAVSEFLISGLRSLEERLDLLWRKVSDFSKNYLKQQVQLLERQQFRLLSGTQQILLGQQSVLTLAENRLRHQSRTYIEKQKHRLAVMEKTVELVHPQKVLERGYTITTHRGKAIGKGSSLANGDELITQSAHYKIISTVNSKKEIKKPKE